MPFKKAIFQFTPLNGVNFFEMAFRLPETNKNIQNIDYAKENYLSEIALLE